MSWYESIPSLTPLVAYDVRSALSIRSDQDWTTDNYLKNIHSRLDDDVNHAHGVLVNLSYMKDSPYKYAMNMPMNKSWSATDKSAFNAPLEIGENWLIYYNIKKHDNVGIPLFYDSMNGKIAMCYLNGYRSITYSNTNVDNNVYMVNIEDAGLQFLDGDVFFEIVIQRSSVPGRSFVRVNGHTYPMRDNYLPNRIISLLSTKIMALDHSFGFTGMAAFGGNIDSSEIPNINAALLENSRELPDPHVEIVGDVEHVRDGEKVEREGPPHVEIVGDPIETVSLMTIYGFSYGEIEGTVHEVFPPAPQEPVSRRVICIQQPENFVVGETWSREGDGYYIFKGLEKTKKYTVLAYDHTGNFTAICCDNIAPQ